MTGRKGLIGLIAAAVVAVLLLSAIASSVYPPVGRSASGRVVGHAVFAYVSGLRTFAAAVLWNRLDPQFHAYYSGRGLDQLTYMLPTIRLVQALDPQFEQAYYVGAWIVARHGDRARGVEIARDGLRANPRSGLMRMNLVSLLVLDETISKRKNAHLAEEVALARESLGEGVVWNSESDRFESLAIYETVFRRAGDAARAKAVAAELRALKTTGVKSAAELEEDEQHEHEAGNGHDHHGENCDHPDHQQATTVP